MKFTPKLFTDFSGNPNETTCVSFPLRFVKVASCRYEIMQFYSSMNIDLGVHNLITLEREDNHDQLKSEQDGSNAPIGASGSEYRYSERKNARLRRLGIKPKDYNASKQPWILTLDNDENKKYKGMRQGGINEHSGYFIFSQAEDGYVDVIGVEEWYNFRPTQRFKPLNSDEAEMKYARRDRVLNHFPRMNATDTDDEDDDEGLSAKMKKLKNTEDYLGDDKKKKKNKHLKRSNSNENMLYGDEDDDRPEAIDSLDDKSEPEYMSTDSDEEMPNEEIKEPYSPILQTVAPEGYGFSNFVSDEKFFEMKPKVKTVVKTREMISKLFGDTNTESDSDNPDDMEIDIIPNEFGKLAGDSGMHLDDLPSTSATAGVQLNIGGVSEDAVRRYLRRKPITPKDLLKKFKSKIKDFDVLTDVINRILKRINPIKKNINGQLYLYLRDRE